LSGNACGMCGLIDPDGAQYRYQLVYETPDGDLSKAAVRDRGGLDENVAVRDALLIFECGENPLCFVVKPVIAVQQRIKRRCVYEDQERNASASSRSCSRLTSLRPEAKAPTTLIARCHRSFAPPCPCARSHRSTASRTMAASEVLRRAASLRKALAWRAVSWICLRSMPS
jgi:hypothetical protein